MERAARCRRVAWALCALVLGLGAAARAQSTDPSVVGQWSPLKSWPLPATHAHLLPTGKVLFFSEFELGDDAPYLWDPVTDQLQQLPPPGYNIFCTGHSFLADGRLLLAGGHIESDRGLRDAIIFDPFSLRWTRLPDMARGRWYPTNTTLPNGEVLVVAGADENKVFNPIPEIWSPEQGAWRRLTGASLSVDYYPFMFVVPDGRVFMAGPSPQTRWLDPSGSGAWISGPLTRYGAKRSYGSAVLYDVGKILIVGGNDPPTNSAEVIDLNQTSPAWRMVPPMSFVRRQHNATLLPDGSVLVTGGHSGRGMDDPSQPRRETELWDPRTETWTQLASMSAYRGYHSVAVLLPDGRVLSAGGRRVDTMQLFSPPYLFKGDRPVISSTPETLSHGQTFTVFTAQAASIAQVTLIRLASVTHAFDENQRFLRLGFREESGNLIVTAPANSRLAPPGHYMLFLVDGRGVPSVAKIVRLGGTTAPPPPPPPPADAVVIGFGSTWKYDDRNVDPGTAWMSPDFDDSGWPSGAAQLGYGDQDERTVLRKTSPVQPSVYFRKKIHVDGTVVAATLRVLFDDAIAVWANGTLVFSRNLTSTAHSAYATSSSGDNARAEATIPPTAFVNGDNTIAVMVKQLNPTSSDVSFDLELSLSVSSDGDHPPAPMLERPNGGESFHAGATERIRWLTHGEMSETVDLEYSTDGGNTWKTIARSVADTGGYDWLVPAENTSRALVRIFPTGSPELADTSEAPFTISTSATFIAIPFGEVWRFNDRNVDPGPTWTSASFDDSTWRHGAGQLGYGDSDEKTVLTPTAPVQPSIYFRKKISFTGKPSAAHVKVLYDDGYVLWVNGRQVASRKVGSLEHSAYATDSAENTVSEVDLDASAFVAGENTLAVMIKQRGPTSSDVSFDLELRVTIP
jgi:galactose oxidase